MSMPKYQHKLGRFYSLPNPQGTSPTTVNDDNLFQLVMDNQLAPSITTITKWAPKPKGQLKDVPVPVPEHLKVARATSVGTEVHAYIESILWGHPFTPELTTDLARLYVESWEEFMRDNRVEPVLIETQVIGEAGDITYAGTIDLLANVNGRLTLVDWKTGASAYLHKSFAQIYAGWKSKHYIDPETDGVVRFADPNPIEQGAIVHLTAGAGHRVYYAEYTTEKDKLLSQHMLDIALEKFMNKFTLAKADRGMLEKEFSYGIAF